MIGEPRSSVDLEPIFASIFKNFDQIVRGSNIYGELETQIAHLQDVFRRHDRRSVFFGRTIGHLTMRNIKMGNVGTANLLDLDELVLFAIYQRLILPRMSYLDLGGNIGLHSAVAFRLGAVVESYEPDPKHDDLAHEFFTLNKIVCRQNLAAIGTADGRVSFTRVLGNSMSSHITGKKNPYGGTETFEVECRDIRAVSQSADFVKIDIEGMEAEALSRLFVDCQSERARRLPYIVCEIGSKENAESIWETVKTRSYIKVRAQKIGWRECGALTDLPVNYKEGSIFISDPEKSGNFNEKLIEV